VHGGIRPGPRITSLLRRRCALCAIESPNVKEVDAKARAPAHSDMGERYDIDDDSAASGTGGQVQGGGLILFASIMLGIIGCFNLSYGIAAIANSHVFVANPHYVFGNLRTWGWTALFSSAYCSCSPRPG